MGPGIHRAPGGAAKRSRSLLVLVLAAAFVAAATAPGAAAQAAPTGDDSTLGDAGERAAEELRDATPEERERVEDLQPDEGPIEEANDEAPQRMEEATPGEEEAADRLDPGRDEPSRMGETNDEAADQLRDATPEQEAAADRVDGDGGDEGGSGPLEGLAIGMFRALGGWMMDAAGSWAESNANRMAEQFTEGRYQTAAPSNELVSFYDTIADFAKPGAIALLLLLGLSMTLRAADYNTAYAAQYGIPKIVVVLAGIAFFPEIVRMLADLSQSIIDQLIDRRTLEAGMEEVYQGNIPRHFAGLTTPIWIVKLVLNLLLYLSVVLKNFLFGLLFVVGPLALVFHAIPGYSDVTGAWLRGVLACLVIPVLWALEFGVGYRFVAEPDMIFGGSGAAGIPSFLLSLGIVYIAYKTPWKVFEWAFYSYSPGGGSGVRTAISALGLLKLFRGAGR